MDTDPRRLSILSARETDELYGLPRFAEAERRLYFDLSAAEHGAVAAVGTVSVAAHLTLQLGYFKAKQQFFDYGQEAVMEDLSHVLGERFPERDLPSIKTPSRPTRMWLCPVSCFSLFRPAGPGAQAPGGGLGAKHPIQSS